MTWKIFALCLLLLTALWDLLLDILSLRSENNPTPDNVRDVYDAEAYQKWRKYHRESIVLDGVFSGVKVIITALLLIFNVPARAAGNISSWYWAAIAVLLVDTAIRIVPHTAHDYISTMLVEQKYGFNRATQKTFWTDQLKNLVLSLLLATGLLCLFIALYQALGDRMVVLFAVLLFIFILLLAFLSPHLLKIFNQFTPLEGGGLKDKLTTLLEKNGYHVKEIKVMDASRRSTKANAFFTGFGKTKTIVLYDTLLESSTTDEICAVFAHEMGHGIHKDTLKNQIIAFAEVIVISLLAWLLVRNPELYQAFGFERVNYGMVLFFLSYCVLPVVSPLMGLISAWYSRRAEYRADQKAAEEGYGEALISALKKLSRENFANLAPDPLVVRLAYDHPTLSQRIDAIERISHSVKVAKAQR